MFFKTPTAVSADSFSQKLQRLRQALDEANAVLIGAGAGLSTSAGFTYDGERFEKYFSDFSARYGFADMYSGGFYPYATLEEYWAYWSRYIWVNRYQDPPRPVYQKLLELVREKDYFVITTNVDHCFQKAGFDKKRLFYTQGDYGLFQCSAPCDIDTWDNREIIRSMVEQQRGLKIPAGLIPKCPKCGRSLRMNLRSDDRFVEDEGWLRAAERYENFLRTRKGERILFLELGVGYNTPVIIKYPFWQMTAKNPRAVYACINDKEVIGPDNIAERTIGIKSDIGGVLEKLNEDR
ncbi:MAG: Sir2 silent information regulator family NAD-dependent deacetylase [Provencibacterium sp.]|nr:Sir2 silent information regulator family NAD-dependent deacetylase [Provencibacterium sp.]